MGGHGYTKVDPAIERWNQMREDVYKTFRFTRRTTFVALCGFVAVPGVILYFSALNDKKWDWAGKLKGQKLRSSDSAVQNST